MRSARLTFNYFMISRALGALCDQFLLFAVPLAVLEETNSAGYAAIAFVIEWIPRVIGFPLIGSVIDGLPLKWVFLVLDVARVVLILVAAALVGPFGAFGTLPVFMAFMSICYVVNFLGIEATIPNNLPEEDFPRAHSLVQGVEQASQVVGPVLAVFLYNTGSIEFVLLACAVLFALSAVNIALLSLQDSSAANSASLARVISTNQAAFKILLKRREILYLSGMTWVVNFVYGTALAISAAMVVQHYDRGSSSLGGMQSVAAVVAVSLFAAIPYLVRRAGIPFVGKLSLAVMIACGFLLGFSPNFLVYAAAYCLLIAFDGGFNVYVRTMRSTVLPKEHLGKIMGIIGALNLLSIPVSGALVSVLASHVSLPGIVRISATISVTLCAAVLLYGKFGLGYRAWFPQLRPATADT